MQQKSANTWTDTGKVNIDLDGLGSTNKFQKHSQPSMNQLQQQSSPGEHPSLPPTHPSSHVVKAKNLFLKYLLTDLCSLVSPPIIFILIEYCRTFFKLMSLQSLLFLLILFLSKALDHSKWNINTNIIQIYKVKLFEIYFHKLSCFSLVNSLHEFNYHEWPSHEGCKVLHVSVFTKCFTERL